ncbi:MAG: hypothetical protein HQ465_19125, partial [Rhodospirillales bacterium]|nr:hypothetical protein [Rhodospirillales bacterium]
MAMPEAKSSRRVAVVARRRPGHRGLVVAYLLVLGLIGGAAGIAFGDFDGKTPIIVDIAVAASSPAAAPLATPAAQAQAQAQ